MYPVSFHAKSYSDPDTRPIASSVPVHCSSPNTDDEMADEKNNDLKLESLHLDDLEVDAAKGQHVKVDEKLSVLESIKRYPKALASCCYMLFICIMWGYDGLAGSVRFISQRQPN